MELRKHLGRGVLLVAALVLVGSATGRLLFASADTGGRIGSIESDTVYGRVSPTSTSMVYYRSASPTSTEPYAVRRGNTDAAVVSVVSNRFADADTATVVRSTTPTSTGTQARSAGYYDWTDTYVQDTPAYTPEEPSGGSMIGTGDETPQQPAAAYTEPTETVSPVMPTAPVEPVEPVSPLATYVALTVNTAVDTNNSTDNFTYDLEYMGASGTIAQAPELPTAMSATAYGGGLANFEDIKFSEEGQYYFRIAQNPDNNATNSGQGYDWNDSWYFVGVRVEAVNGVLVPTVSYYEMSDGGLCIPRGANAFFTQVHTY